MGEVGQNAGKEPARDVRFGGDPVGARLLSQPGEVKQSSQGVASLAAQLQAQPSVLSLVPVLLFSLIPDPTSKICTASEIVKGGAGHEEVHRPDCPPVKGGDIHDA